MIFGFEVSRLTIPLSSTVIPFKRLHTFFVFLFILVHALVYIWHAVPISMCSVRQQVLCICV